MSRRFIGQYILPILKKITKYWSEKYYISQALQPSCHHHDIKLQYYVEMQSVPQVKLSAAILCPDKHPQLETEHISSPRQETCWLVVSRHFLKGQRNWVLECVTGPVKPASQPALWILLSNPNCPNRLRCDHSSHWADSSLIHLVKVHRVKQWMEISVNGWCQTECYNPRHQKCFCGGVPIRLW